MDSRFSSANHDQNASPSQMEEKLHITAKGREGRALRKKLAISLGLRVPSSTGSSASTTSHSEEEPEQAQNVLEMFRKQVKLTASQRRQLPNLNSEQQQVLNEDSSMSIRKTIHRRTTTTTREFLDDGDYLDDRDYQERSQDQTEIHSKHERHDNTATHHQKTITKTNNSLSQQVGSNQLTDRSTRSDATSTNANTKTTEEIFSSSGGEENAIGNMNSLSTDNSVKLLRQKIRANTRARKLPRPVDVDHRYGKQDERVTKDKSSKKVEDRTSISVNKQTKRKISGSQIPIRFGKKSDEKEKVIDQELRVTNKENKQENETDTEVGNKSLLVQKSKIPRRKSQNSADRKDVTNTTDSRIESLISEVFESSSSNNEFTTYEKEQKRSDRLKIDINEGRHKNTDDEISVKLTQELNSGIDSETLFYEAPTNSSAATSAEVLNTVPATFSTSATSSTLSTIDLPYQSRDSMSASIETKTNKINTNQSRKSKFTDILTKHKSLDVFRQSFSTMTNQGKSKDRTSSLNFDSLEVELAKLKTSVFRTYEDFQEMKDLTHILTMELNEIRNVSYV